MSVAAFIGVVFCAVLLTLFQLRRRRRPPTIQLHGSPRKAQPGSSHYYHWWDHNAHLPPSADHSSIGSAGSVTPPTEPDVSPPGDFPDPPQDQHLA